MIDRIMCMYVSVYILLFVDAHSFPAQLLQKRLASDAPKWAIQALLDVYCKVVLSVAKKINF